MPVSMEFENDGRGVVISAQGILDADFFAQANKALYVPDVMEKLRYQIVDLSSVEKVDIDWEHIKYLAEMDKQAAKSIPGLKIAVVAPAGVLEALAQVYQRLAKDDSLSAQVFRNMVGARQWIGECLTMERSA